MRVEVVAFAALRDALGGTRIPLDLPDGATGRDLRERLAEAHPRYRELIRSCRLARGVDFVDDADPLAGGELILIPPVSGGSGPPAVLLTRDPLDGEALKAAAYAAAAGGVVIFEGTVRSPSEGKDVLYLEYEAYEPMALAQMERIVAQVRAEWPVAGAFLHHRLGKMEVGEVSVVAVASAPHRDQAFTACRALIERLKADVPIWKREVTRDGAVWVGACAPSDPDR